MKKNAAHCLKLMLAAMVVAASVLTVTGYDEAKAADLNVPSREYPDIASAMRAAQYGSTITVAAGTYLQSITLKNGVVLQGAGAAVTFIDGVRSGSVVTIVDADATTKIDGFTITGGTGTRIQGSVHGGGLYLSNSAVTVSNCTISRNEAQWGGGMSALNSSTATIVQCVFEENAARFQGGGLYTRGGGLVVSDCTFRANQTLDDDERGGGGGISNAMGSNATITDCTFIGNATLNDGGGIFNFESSPTIRRCLFSGNSAAVDSGGGLRNTHADAIITDCAFKDNVAMWGGGISNKWSDAIIGNCTFENNVGTVEGGAIHDHDAGSQVTNCLFKGNSGLQGGAIVKFTETTANTTTIADCEFYGNRADKSGGALFNITTDTLVNRCVFEGNVASQGGAIYARTTALVVHGSSFKKNAAESAGGGILGSDSSLDLVSCIFEDNTAGQGGALASNDSSVLMANALIAGNTATGSGGGVHSNNSTAVLYNCLFTGNRADRLGGAVYSYKSSGTIVNGILWGDAPHEIFASGASWNATYSDVQVAPGVFAGNVYPGTGNINADPSLAADFSLRPGSPCLDSGDPLTDPRAGLDLRGVARPVDGDGNGTPATDMGPLEYTGAPAPTTTQAPTTPADGGSGGRSASPWRNVFLLLVGSVLVAAAAFTLGNMIRLYLRRRKQ